VRGGDGSGASAVIECRGRFRRVRSLLGGRWSLIENGIIHMCFCWEQRRGAGGGRRCGIPVTRKGTTLCSPLAAKVLSLRADVARAMIEVQRHATTAPRARSRGARRKLQRKEDPSVCQNQACTCRVAGILTATAMASCWHSWLFISKTPLLLLPSLLARVTG
jgi:hypothetical protein